MKKVSALILSTILLLSFSTMASADYIRDEKESLRIKHEAKMRKCAKLKSKKRSSCVTKNKSNYKASLSLLKENPDAYFASKGSARSKSRSNQNTGGIIYDGNGKPYYRTAGGLVDDQGVFYSQGAGGYTNSRTGEFLPAN